MKEFDYQSNSGDVWKIRYKSDGKYRNMVLMKQIRPEIKDKGRFLVIMLNPGSFNDEKGFARDFTLRKLRQVFLNTGYEIEIVNIYNYCEPKKEKLSELDPSVLSNKNPMLRNILRFNEGDKVLIAWGKLDSDASIIAQEIINKIKKQKLVPIGLMTKDGKSYSHPRSWLTKEKVEKVRKLIVTIPLDSNAID